MEYEPKKQNRFYIEFPTELDIEHWLVQTSGKPKFKQNSVEIPYMNTSFWVAGRYTWEAVDIEFIDCIGPSTSQKLMGWVRLHAESETGRQGYAAGYKKDLILHEVDPTGVSVSKWVMYGCMITAAEFGSNDYSQDEVQKVKVTVQPDWCSLAY